MPHVLSVSRRTDIPAFYADWFVNRLRAGRVYVQNPYSKKMSLVSLKPEDMSAVVFWSKNYALLLDKLDEVEKTTKHLFFHFTITANRELEPHTPAYADATADYRFLVRRYSPEQVIWRYDPICITDKLSFEMHEERFVRCAEMLQGLARKCIISFVHPYKKVLSNMQKFTEHHLADLSIDEKRACARRLAERAKTCGIALYACCNDHLLSDHVQKAACIDGRYLSSVFKVPLDTRPTLTREECACTKSIDIGAYDTCAHGCIYCYATVDPKKAHAKQQAHNPEWNAINMDVREDVPFHN